MKHDKRADKAFQLIHDGANDSVINQLTGYSYAVIDAMRKDYTRLNQHHRTSREHHQ